MKVLLLFTFGVSLKQWDKIGILEREITLYKKLKEKDIKFKFLTYGTNEEFHYSEKLKDIDIIPIHNLIKSRISILKVLKSILIPLKLKNLFKDIDIIKTNQVEGWWVALLAKLLYKKKIIIRGGYEWFRNFLSTPRAKGIFNYFKFLLNYIYVFISEFLAYKLADKIILTNKSDIDFIVDTFSLKKKKSKIEFLPNFIDISLFKPLNAEKLDKHIIFIGRLDVEKNLYNLLKAMELLNNYYLDIVGSGPLERNLKNEVKKMKGNINFLGIYPNNKIPEILNQYDIFILPSIFECNPKVLLEAMSCGISCIGTNVRGINGIITHKENGYLCAINSNSIKNAIQYLYNNKDLREKISKNAREFIINNCSLEKIAEKEANLYKLLSNQKS